MFTHFFDIIIFPFCTVIGKKQITCFKNSVYNNKLVLADNQIELSAAVVARYSCLKNVIK